MKFQTITVSWFSAGVSSAVACWLFRDSIDRIIYQHIDDQEQDTLRFVDDCRAWIGKPIEIIQSELKTVESACMYRQYINGRNGAACSRMLKRELRKQWEIKNMFFNRFRYVWGMDAQERDRAERIVEDMPEIEHVFPLIDFGISKKEAHGILSKHGVRRPRMYDLGYSNNNCIGCVKGGRGYWNKIRKDFPDVFKRRCEMERVIGATCLNGTYLDKLDPKTGREQGVIVPECGAACQSEGNYAKDLIQ